MKTKVILQGLLIVLLMTNAVTTETFGKNIDESDVYQTLKRGYLGGQSVNIKDNLKWAEVADARKIVWNCWKKMLNDIDRQTLIPLAPLSMKNESRWHLPETLEPNATMPYYYGSKGERPDEGYPLFVYLHGSGPKDMEWAIGYRLACGFVDGPSAYFIPQIPNMGQLYRWWQRAKQYAWEMLLREAFASEQLDPYRFYMFGISEGGYGSQRLASFYADYFAAFGPMAGGEPLKNAPAENLSNVAFSLRTGDKDYGFYRNELTQVTNQALDSLQRLYPEEFRHEVDLVKGYGHGIPYGVTPTWLRNFRRNPYPRHFLWEDYDMDGIHRKGFYNIAIHEPENVDPSTRTRYDVTIQDNVVTLDVKDVKYQCTEVDPRFGIEKRFAKTYAPLSRKIGVTLYLCDELVDFSRPVTVMVNGRKAYRGKLKPSLGAMTTSLLCFNDPLRVFPTAVEIVVGA